ncbi:DUF6083 domain-containing protein [Streptomyces sp. NBC_00353]|uniref:DUF6083 domain-containing protein n=1 Tax=Streptomyces sp. NBC_00353 TaxID=2975722 RepID=UPI002E256AA5
MSSTASSGRRWDGTPARPHRQRALRVAPDSLTRLVRSAQSSRCRDCGNRIDWYTRTDNRPVSLHPHELDATAVPVASRWHVSSGIAHLAGDGTPWCRIPHLALCPARPAPSPLTPQVAALRRHLALHTRRLLDAGTLTPSTPDAASPATALESCRPARPIVLLLHTRYLAAQPVDTIQCVAQTRRRHRCTHPVLSPSAPAGTWTLVPATTGRRQLARTGGLMAAYDLTHLTYAEQLRWRHQRCPTTPPPRAQPTSPSPNGNPSTRCSTTSTSTTACPRRSDTAPRHGHENRTPPHTAELHGDGAPGARCRAPAPPRP